MNQNTSWTNVGEWYNKSVGKDGHFFHREVILPNVLRLLKFASTDRVLDLGCGQGVLARALPPVREYLGIDLSTLLIEEARKLNQATNHRYAVSDVSKDLPIKYPGFNKVAIILALQNIKNQFGVIRNVEKYMSKDGTLLIVLNHPSFRIPKNADWGVDKSKGIQYRRVDSYLTPLTIPIELSPFDQKNSEKTWSYHYPLSAYSEMLLDNGMVIEKIEEWTSPKRSEGGMAKIEDTARKEFPMFMCIVARRKA